MDTNKQALHPGTLSPEKTFFKPEFFPLPQKARDPHFGLGRSSYYDLEKRGLLRLIRLRKPGNQLGKVLVPYDETVKLIRRLSASVNTTAAVSASVTNEGGI